MSIQRYLFLLIISVVTLATFGAALRGYRASMAELDMILDQELVVFAQALAVMNTDERIIKQKDQANLAFQVWDKDQLLFRSSNSPKFKMSKVLEEFSVQNFLGARWRIYANEINHRRVFVAQLQSQRIDSTERVLLKAISPIVLSIPLIGLLVLLAVRRSLSPLRQLSKQLNNKSQDDLGAIKVKRNSKELEPIVETLNSVFLRLQLAFSREQRLASDAAHELRTPTSVLSIAVHNLTSSFENNSLTTESFDELGKHVDRMAHAVEQILALYRTSPEAFNQQFTSVDIEMILQTVIASLYEKIEIQHQMVSLDAQQYFVSGDEFSLITLFENLVSNANKYSGENSEIKLSVINKMGGIFIVVEDSGPGISSQARERIFDRFYRIEADKNNPAITGCGLGMSIVKHIVELHQGTIDVEQSSLGGLKVAILFPHITERQTI